MARNAPAITCGPEDRQELERLAGSRTESKQMIERAQIILGCLAGKRVKEVARSCHTRPNTVIKWRQRFAQLGLAGLRDAPRPGAKPVYGAEFRNAPELRIMPSRNKKRAILQSIEVSPLFLTSSTSVLRGNTSISRVSLLSLSTLCISF